MTAAYTIGRHAQVITREHATQARRASMLIVCRRLMSRGDFHPQIVEITGKTRKHDVANIFGDVTKLYEEALDDATVDAIADHALRGRGSVLSPSERLRLALGFVFGRLGE